MFKIKNSISETWHVLKDYADTEPKPQFKLRSLNTIEALTITQEFMYKQNGIDTMKMDGVFKIVKLGVIDCQNIFDVDNGVAIAFSALKLENLPTEVLLELMNAVMDMSFASDAAKKK